MAELVAVGVDDDGAFAHRHPLQADQADPLGGRAGGELAVDHRGAGVAAVARAAGAPHLLDRPGEAGFDRRGGRVDVVAVQAQAGLQAQRVARAQADRADLGLREQRARQRFGLLGRHRDLEAVLAGVARAGDETLGAGQRTVACRS